MVQLEHDSISCNSCLRTIEDPVVLNGCDFCGEELCSLCSEEHKINFNLTCYTCGRLGCDECFNFMNKRCGFDCTPIYYCDFCVDDITREQCFDCETNPCSIDCKSYEQRQLSYCEHCSEYFCCGVHDMDMLICEACDHIVCRNCSFSETNRCKKCTEDINKVSSLSDLTKREYCVIC